MSDKPNTHDHQNADGSELLQPSCSNQSEVIDWIIGFLEGRLQEIDAEYPELKDWMPSPVRAVEGAIRREEIQDILEILRRGNF